MTQQRDGPTAARAGPPVAEAVSAWLVQPYTPGDTSHGGCDSFDGADLVIYGPDAARFRIMVALDAKPASHEEGTINVTSDMFYTSDDPNGWLLIDSPPVHRRVRDEIERVCGCQGMFLGEEELSTRHRNKALRALEEALPNWGWLCNQMGAKQLLVRLDGHFLVVGTGTREAVIRFTVSLDKRKAEKTVLPISLDAFHHPAVRPWEVLNMKDAKSWGAFQQGVEHLLTE